MLCFQLKLAVKPEFSIGLVMFVRGYDESEFMVLTLEGEDVRLRVNTLDIFVTKIH